MPTKTPGRKPQPCLIDGIVYPSRKRAGEVLGLSESGVRKRIRRGRPFVSRKATLEEINTERRIWNRKAGEELQARIAELSDAQVCAAFEMANDGLSYAEIGRRLRIFHEIVRALLEEQEEAAA